MKEKEGREGKGDEKKGAQRKGNQRGRQSAGEGKVKVCVSGQNEWKGGGGEWKV